MKPTEVLVGAQQSLLLEAGRLRRPKSLILEAGRRRFTKVLGALRLARRGLGGGWMVGGQRPYSNADGKKLLPYIIYYYHT